MKKKRLLLILILAVLAALSITVFACELISRRYYRRCIRYTFLPESVGLSCRELGIKYGTSEEKPLALLFEVKAKRESGVAVSKDEYRRLAEALVFEVDREDLGGSNGQACGYWGYVSRDLPGQAKKFVKRHELTHILGVGSEFQANKEAGLEYPFGLIQTTFISAWRGLSTPSRPFVCKITLLWTTFKEYFLPWSWEPPVIIF